MDPLLHYYLGMARSIHFQGHICRRYVLNFKYFYYFLRIVVMVQNFERISEAIKKQKAAQLRQRKFQRMRNKLDTELAAQHGIEQSM